MNKSWLFENHDDTDRPLLCLCQEFHDWATAYSNKIMKSSTGEGGGGGGTGIGLKQWLFNPKYSHGQFRLTQNMALNTRMNFIPI